ncbi:MAG: hydroxymethylglutaryl-CoA lyase [Candidatus Calescibacterium sp.]|nr:hydroxymethylglutaryl-CoA lyase [Candidatus Calescibacterium sp.]MDW8132071.1 hydroxymethylglutaryl-CoA lyase [Candidatus Calescibacterium sp.]
MENVTNLIDRYVSNFIGKEVIVRELGPREGFQIQKNFIDTSKKIELINCLSGTGIKYLEVTSFVNPKLVPNLADAQEVLKNINRNPGVIYACLVLNKKGVELAIQNNVKYLNTTIFASESLNKRNNNRTIEESMKEAEEMIKLCNDNNIILEGGVSATFGCPIQKYVDFKKVLEIVEFWYSNGIKSIMLADTTGEALPQQVYAYISILREKYEDVNFIIHLHDTRGIGMVNLLVAVSLGISHVDCSIGGLGGCPFAPGAAGNIPTEDTVYLLNSLGFKTGIDLDKLVQCSLLAEKIVGYKIPGKLKDYKLSGLCC